MPRPRCSSPEAAWSTCSPLTTRRSSLSRGFAPFGDLNVNGGEAHASAERVRRGRRLGTWTVEMHSPPVRGRPVRPGRRRRRTGGTTMAISATATSQAAAGDDYGSRAAARHDDPPRAVRLLRHAPRPRARTRRGPAGSVASSAGNTINGPNRVNVYRWPSALPGHPPDYTRRSRVRRAPSGCTSSRTSAGPS